MRARPCPPTATLKGLLAGTPGPGDLDWLEGHLGACGACRARLETLALGSSSGTGPTATLGRGEATVDPLDDLRRHFRPPPRPGVLGLFGPFEVLGLVGRGGMGIVLRARDPRLDRVVAVKVLAPMLAVSPTARARFLREARAAAAVAHDHVVPIHAVDEVRGLPALIMRLIEGESLAERIARRGRLEPGEVVRIGSEVASGLAAAHARGLIHRDIKPANILLEAPGGRALLVDFGLARAIDDAALTLPGTRAGTPEFMAPEQAAGEPVDQRADLFSLGLVLYMSCTGVSPFRSGSISATFRRLASEDPPPPRSLVPEIPAWLDRFITRLLARDPSRRPQTAEEVARLLGDQLGKGRRRSPEPEARPAGVASREEGSGAIPDGVPARRQSPRRARAGLLGAAVLLVGLMAAIPSRLTAPAGRGARPSEARPSPPAPRATPTDLPVSSLAIVGRRGTFGDLSEAIAAAADGDVIAVRGPGPFAVRPIAIAGKRLRLRAAPGPVPRFLARADEVWDRPLLTTDSDLALEGLEFRGPSLRPAPNAAEGVLAIKSRCLIFASGGTLEATHCGFDAGPGGTCLGAAAADAHVRRSRFRALPGHGLAWVPPAGGRWDAEDCLFEGDVAIGVLASRAGPVARPATLRIADSTLRARVALELRPRIGGGLLGVVAERDLFDVDHVLHVIPPRPARRPPPGSDLEGLAALLPRFAPWSDQDNVYRAATSFLSRPLPRRPRAPLEGGPADAAGWRAFWGLGPTGSVSARVRRLPPSDDSPRAQVLGFAIEEPSGPLPARFGADLRRVGPSRPPAVAEGSP